jgi:hypothetical protein
MSGTNPYAPPKAQVEDVVPFAGEADEIRREHIKTEASIRSIGSLYYLGGGLMVAAAFFLPTFGGKMFGGMPPAVAGIVMVVCLAFGGGSLFVGRGLRALRPWARTTAIVLSSLSCIAGLARPSLGIAVNIYILYLLLSKKGRRIFESDYPEIVAATPDVKYGTSILVWILLGLVVLLILAAVVIPAVHRAGS